MVNVLLIEPYYGGSHQAWANGYQRNSRHPVTLLTLPAQFWKWRMQGAAVTLARLLQGLAYRPDVILASDMMNLATFKALLPKPNQNTPIALYFHETQLTYPQNSRQKHGWRYGFINYISALAADAIFFNGPYHLEIFYKTLPNMLKHFGDYNELQTVEWLRRKSSVLSLGMDLRRFDAHRLEKPPGDQPPLIVWNHRWEEDKNPTLFFRALYGLMERGIAFRVAITGENFRQNPAEFVEARERLGERVIQYGYMPDFASYARLLWEADYVISTSKQDFFGGSVAEAIYCGCVPILPWRLNYPHLLPEGQRDACLYKGNQLRAFLERHLCGEVAVDRAALHAAIKPVDWAIMAKKYDDELERLAASVDE